MTRADIEKDIRGVTRTCKGTPRFSYEDQQKVFQRWPFIEATHNWTSALIFKRALEQTLGRGEAVFNADDWEAITAHVMELIFGSSYNCGFDINDLILNEPLDGLDHCAACPGCGSFINWSPAIYDETE